MDIFYEGKNITEYVTFRSCLFYDCAGGKLDSLEIVLDNAKAWNRWNPQPDDRIEIVDGQYSTGKLYLSAPAPEDDRFKIIATSAPTAAKKRGWQSFKVRTIGEIMNICAAACGMKWALFGIDPNAPIPYIERENESYLAFLQRLMSYEGGTLKCVNSKLTGITYAYAQDLPVNQTIKVSSDGIGTSYMKRNDIPLRAATVKTLFASAQAVDSSVEKGGMEVYTQLPALSNLQAGRWARGILLSNNRKAETVTIESKFNESMTALARVNVTGDTAANGEWLVEEAEHDFVNRSTSIQMHRCIRTVY